MDDRNLTEMVQRIFGINQHLGRAQAWTRGVVRRQIKWEGYDVNLTTGQVNRLTTDTGDRLTRLENVAASLEGLTGFLGVPIDQIVDSVAAEPESFGRVINTTLQQLQALVREPDLAADDTMRFEIDDETAQQLAHLAATIRDSLAIVAGVLRARLGL